MRTQEQKAVEAVLETVGLSRSQVRERLENFAKESAGQQATVRREVPTTVPTAAAVKTTEQSLEPKAFATGGNVADSGVAPPRTPGTGDEFTVYLNNSGVLSTMVILKTAGPTPV